jgi:AraC family transcriptional regulator, regulatory protein of adaptative response / methylated-DNA-[protein]-cysteine methyltransferase
MHSALSKQIDFSRVAKAIEFIHSNFKSQPELDEIAKTVNLSPFHFQRLFTEWAGVSPKKFLQYTTVKYAKGLLEKNMGSLFDVTFESGLSTTSRLHDLFVKIEAMTPGEYKNGGASLNINFSFSQTIFGTILIASTAKGICHVSFADDQEIAVEELRSQFPGATYTETEDPFHKKVIQFFSNDWSDLHQVKLHLKGSPFQLKVWEALLKIPAGEVTTYSVIAKHLNNSNASRAVGSAVGSNPVAFLIPCHRVIKATGVLGAYHWGATRKIAMIGLEGVATYGYAE